MYQFTMFLDQPFFYDHVVIKMPFMCLVTYNVINDNEVVIMDIAIPYTILRHLNLASLEVPAMEAAINNALSLELIGNNEIEFINNFQNNCK